MSRGKRKKDEKRGRRHPWRENIEALTMAVAVALLFKVFILEISRIPSGSMQPTLMGSPQANVFDRVLVDKLSYAFRDPERFEIVVFRHPLERSRVMVKRLVGMPEEELKIEHGDLWTRPDADSEWRIVRKPEKVQRAMWRRLDRNDRRLSVWAQLDGVDWRLEGRDIEATGPGAARYRIDQESIVDEYTDGYHDALRADIGNLHHDSGVHPVGDVRLEGVVRMTPSTTAVVFTLTEGRQTYEFRLPGPAGTEEQAHVRWLSDERAEVAGLATGRLEASEDVEFAIENLDDRIALEVDGESVTLDVDPQADQRSTLSLAVRGGAASFEDLTVYRDIYYYLPASSELPGSSEPWTVAIPAGHHVVLGDNTQDSADSRAWRSVTISWGPEEARRTRSGNYRPGLAQPNPIEATFPREDGPDALGWAFRDVWGERHWIPQDEIVAGPVPGARYPGDPEFLVPRELVQGRAVAVFWPLQPSRMMWRLGWLH